MNDSLQTSITITDADDNETTVEVTVEYDIDPGERGDHWHPEYPAGVSLLSVIDLETGRDYLDELSERQVRDLEQEVADDAYATAFDGPDDFDD